MKNRRWLILIIIGLLLIPFNLFVPDVSAGIPVSDGEVPVDGSQLSWNDTLSELCINLSDAEGDGMEYTISQNSVVLESGGTFVYTNTTHNFTDTTNNSAYWESSPTSLRLTGETEFTVGEYQNISGWSYYKKITIDHTKVDNDLANFPILIYNDSDSDVGAHAQSDGDDIFFTDSTNTIQYNHEIDEFSVIGGIADYQIWVNITSLSSTTDTMIWMCYGNSDASNQENVADTWNANYTGVYHFNQSDGSFQDSTSNSNTGINVGTTENTTGILGYCRAFSGVNQYINLGSSDMLDIGTHNFTFEAYVYPRNLYPTGNTEQVLHSRYEDGDNRHYFRLRQSDYMQHYVVENGIVYGSLDSTVPNVANYSWYHVAAVTNRSADILHYYVNGTHVDDGGTYDTGGGALDHTVDVTVSGDTRLGIYQTQWDFNGSMDEVRFSNCLRNDSWIKTTYETSFNHADFLSFSEQSKLGVNTSSCVYPYSHHYFVFNLSEYNSHNITNIDVNWYGYAGYKTSGAKPKWYWDASLHVKKGSWGSAANQTPSPYTGDPVLEWINYSFDNGHIHSDGTVHIAIENTVADDCSRIYTDYIELIVTTIGGGVGNGTYCTSNVSWWNDTCGTVWSWVVYVDDGRDGSSSTTYTFTNAPCVFSGTIYPTSGSVGVCPCSDAICIDVTADYKFNMTIYGREQGSLYWHVWNSYTNISADEYCFCMDAIHPTIRSHAVFHRHVALPITVIDIWYNVTSFEHGIGKDMVINDDHIVIPSHGRYAITYWAAVRDDDANPTGHKMAIRVTCNDAEIDGSYRELFFTNQGYEMHLSGQVQDEFFEDDIIRFQYIGDDTDQEIATYGTWSDDNICYYGYIRKTGMEEHHPLMFNTTYEWYVNVSKFDNSSLYNETDVFSFTTAINRSDCIVSASVGGGRYSYMGIIGLCGLFAIPVSFILYSQLKKRKRPPQNNQNIRGYNWNY